MFSGITWGINVPGGVHHSNRLSAHVFRKSFPSKAAGFRQPYLDFSGLCFKISIDSELHSLLEPISESNAGGAFPPPINAIHGMIRDQPDMLDMPTRKTRCPERLERIYYFGINKTSTEAL